MKLHFVETANVGKAIEDYENSLPEIEVLQDDSKDLCSHEAFQELLMGFEKVRN